MAGNLSDFAQVKPHAKRAVSISRKDTIIIAMLVNIALLAVLFATASRQTHSQVSQKPQAVVANLDLAPKELPQPVVAKQAPVDEIDEILKNYALKTEQVIAPPQIVAESPIQPTSQPAVQAVVAQVAPQVAPESRSTFEVSVQKGDVLSKIAKRYNVKVEDIILLNKLETAKLKIGQILKIPATTQSAKIQTQSSQKADSEFYIVQSGDSPWKIAKKCHIKTEDLLRLNNLDEEKARNLKIGQKLRIR